MSRERQSVGPYRLVSRLARGGFAEVYVGVDERQTEGPPVAVKILERDGTGATSSLGKFRQEGMLGARLHHPNLTQVLDVGETVDALFIVMELLTGQTLGELLVDGGPWTAGAVVGVGLQLLAGLGYAHGLTSEEGAPLGLVHRDIKPSNLFLTTGGVAKVIDFGIALVDDSHRTQTRTGVFLGTLAYAAPEQARAAPTDARADLFSLGLVLYELLTGVRVFSQTHEAGIVGALLFEPIPSVHQRAPEVPPAVADAVGWALQRDPALRPASAAIFADALRRALRPEDIAAPETLARMLEARGAQGSPSRSPRTLTQQAPSLVPSPVGGSATPPRALGGKYAWLGIAGAVLLGAVVWGVAASGLRHSQPAADLPPPVAPVRAAPLVSRVHSPESESERSATPSRRSKRLRTSVQRAAVLAPGWLSIDSRPEWAEVFIDGVTQGPTPLFRHPLTPGRHAVDARVPDGRRQQKTVDILEGVERALLLSWPP